MKLFFMASLAKEGQAFNKTRQPVGFQKSVHSTAFPTTLSDFGSNEVNKAHVTFESSATDTCVLTCNSSG